MRVFILFILISRGFGSEDPTQKKCVDTSEQAIGEEAIAPAAQGSRFDIAKAEFEADLAIHSADAPGGKKLVSRDNLIPMIMRLKTAGFAGRVLAKMLRDKGVVTDGQESEWTDKTVKTLLDQDRDNTILAWKGKPVATREERKQLWDALRARGYSEGDILAVFNSLEVGSQKWSLHTFRKEFGESGPRKGDAAFKEYKDGEKKTEHLARLLGTLQTELRDEKAITDALNREGVAPSAGESKWTPENFRKTLDDIQARVVRRVSDDQRFALSYRSVQNQIMLELDELGFSAREIARALDRQKVPTPTGTPWSYGTVARRIKEAREGLDIRPTLVARYPWRRFSPNWKAELEVETLKVASYESEDINRVIVSLRWHGLTFDAIAEVLNKAGVKNREGKTTWDAAQMKKRIDAFTERALARYEKDLSDENLREFVIFLDLAMASPKQIAELLNKKKMKRLGLDGEWTELDVGNILSSKPRDGSGKSIAKQTVHKSADFGNAGAMKTKVSSADSILASFGVAGKKQFSTDELVTLFEVMHFHFSLAKDHAASGVSGKVASDEQLAKARVVRDAIVKSFLPYIYNQLKQKSLLGHAHAMAFESELNRTLMFAVEGFDYRGSVPFQGYLKQAVDNGVARIQQEARRAARFASGTDPDKELNVIDTAPDKTGSPSRPVELADLQERVNKALEKLDPTEQEIIRMRMFEEKTLEEIATKLGVSIPTVSNRLQKAFGKLRRDLGDDFMPE